MHGEIPFNVPFRQTSRPGKRPGQTNVPARQTSLPGKRPVHHPYEQLLSFKKKDTVVLIN